ncbi:Transcriptional regulatory protein LiaR [bioreactor metagenome]|uniref:Transcriptional regulatory protein LiaR n=1 Tax=bioreactor metagenome TaxID=1076179 RepID=A0A644TJU7_9ZZZZ|nr:response regulator transcription factor [Acidaminococcaceae bacterium]
MKILLVDDNCFFRDGLANLLSAYDVKIVGKAGNGLEALQKMRSLNVDVILMDIYMPCCNGLEAAKLIKKEFPNVKIVMMTVSEEDENLFTAIRNGACGYLLKNFQAEKLLEMLSDLEHGEPPLAPGMAMKIIREFAGNSKIREKSLPENNEPLDALTTRQERILFLVANGKTYRQIAEKLYFSERTIKYEIKSILDKLQLHNRAEAVAYAKNIGLVYKKKAE